MNPGTSRCTQCGQRTPAAPVALPVKAGFVLLAAGITAALFLHDWRWAAMGLVALVLAAVLGGTPNRTGDTPA